jgi:DNA polymerase
MKEEALKRLAEIMASDLTLPLADSANLVFGEGDANAQILFIGEAPGANEDREVRPFVGRAGQLLRKSIRKLGWDERAVYITNIVKRRPPENRDPNEEELVAYEPYLARQIAIIDPKVIITLGRFSMAYFVPNAKITRDQGKVLVGRGRTIVPILHPAAALRSPEMLRDFERTFSALPTVLAELGVDVEMLKDPGKKLGNTGYSVISGGTRQEPEEPQKEIHRLDSPRSAKQGSLF